MRRKRPLEDQRGARYVEEMRWRRGSEGEMVNRRRKFGEL